MVQPRRTAPGLPSPPRHKALQDSDRHSWSRRGHERMRMRVWAGVQGNHVYISQRVIAGTHTTRYWRASLFLAPLCQNHAVSITTALRSVLTRQ